ncbi:MAG TPA: hypothetical protein VF120_13630 [Ktedonobacterales bacterium]
MAGQRITGVSQDQMRFGRAERLLQRPAYMVAVEQVVDALDPSAPPAVASFAGGKRLASARRIGLFAGSYNPLTSAHVALADAAHEQAQLDDIVWAISRVTVDKERVTRACVADRLAQLVAFARPRRETVALVNRGLYVDQVRALRAAVRLDARVLVLLGYDKVVQIFDPHYYTDREAALSALFADADLLVAPRDAFGANDIAALLARPENHRYASHVKALTLPSEHLHDSSTAARQLAAEPARNRAALERLVPPEALALIATRAYSPSNDYTLRQQWLAALAVLSDPQLRRVPPLLQLTVAIQRLPDGEANLRAAAIQPNAQATIKLLRAAAHHDAEGGSPTPQR